MHHLQPDPGDPRCHGKRQIKALARSIKTSAATSPSWYGATACSSPAEGLEVVQAAKPDHADDVPPVAGPAATHPGELWLLADQRVLCGNSLELTNWTKELEPGHS